MSTDERLGRALGVFSLGLGIPQVVAPGRFAKAIGARGDRDDHQTASRLVGVRELLAAGGLLAQPRQPIWAWSRVAGDVMDLALLTGAMRTPKTNRQRLALATVAVVGVTALDIVAGARLAKNGKAGKNGTESGTDASTQDGSPVSSTSRATDGSVTAVTTINRTPDELYAFWRDLTNLPRFMKNVESVEVREDGRSHWKVKAPVGAAVEWDAEVTEDRPGEVIAWRSTEDADVQNSGEVRFVRAPRARGTEVHVRLHYSPPGGPVGAAVAKLTREDPTRQAHEDLRRFKQVMETGEVVMSEGKLPGGFPMPEHPAVPAAAEEMS